MIGYSSDTTFDFGQCAPRKVKTKHLAFGGKLILGQPVMVTDFPNFWTNNVEFLDLLHRRSRKSIEIPRPKCSFKRAYSREPFLSTMKPVHSMRQQGLSLAVVVLILGILAIVALLFREQIVSAVMPPPRRLHTVTYIDHDSHRFQPDRYKLVIGVYHEADAPLSGRIVVTIHGQGKFRPLEESGEQNAKLVDDHTVMFDAPNWEAGKSNGHFCIFDLTSSKLNENGLTEDQVKDRISVKLESMFAKPGEDINSASTISMVIGKGSSD